MTVLHPQNPTDVENSMDPTRVVTTTEDNNSPGSLRYEINNALPGDTIIFNINLLATITLTLGPITIDKTLTINGPGADLLTINGNENRIFIIRGATTVVTIRGIGFANGFSEDNGGAILNENATLNLRDCLLIRNNSNSSGGAIANISGTVTVTNSTFSGNSTPVIFGIVILINSNVM